jgi:hypothetical protein
MAHGKADKAKLTDKFIKRIDELKEMANTQADQFRKFDAFRKWHTPEDLKDANLYDTPGMSSPTWDRNEINQIYSNDVLAGPGKGGTTGGQIAMKLQCDFLAAEERAWRLRHINLVRAACLSHGRIKRHGNSKMSVFEQLKNLIDTYIQASASEAKGSQDANIA